jgi:hypothetical protein
MAGFEDGKLKYLRVHMAQGNDFIYEMTGAKKM